MQRVGGKDATKQFWKVRHSAQSEFSNAALRLSRWDKGLTDLKQYHNESILKKYQGKLKIGDIKEEAKL